MKIILERFSGETETLLYDDFSLEDQEKYRLKFGDFHGKEDLDNLMMLNGVGFSTKDHDNDWKVNEHCGLNFGPWWHRECNTNINGENLGPDSNGMGIINKYSLHWHSFGEALESLKSVKMAIRPLPRRKVYA